MKERYPPVIWPREANPFNDFIRPKVLSHCDEKNKLLADCPLVLLVLKLLQSANLGRKNPR